MGKPKTPSDLDGYANARHELMGSSRNDSETGNWKLET